MLIVHFISQKLLFDEGNKNTKSYELSKFNGNYFLRPRVNFPTARTIFSSNKAMGKQTKSVNKVLIPAESNLSA